jgi:UDP-N-acetylmuramoyl-tripeptide--D-alanyl-D-alanine ligase
MACPTQILFLLLRGPNYDGNAFIAEAFWKGAVAVVVDREIPRGAPPEGGVLRVADTLQALRQLAAWALQTWGGRLVAVTAAAESFCPCRYFVL